MSIVRLIDAEKYPCTDCTAMYCYKNCDEFEKWRLGCDYDIDKVVEEMKANSKKMSEAKVNFDVDGGHAYYKAIGTRKCEEIIRGGLKC